ncbi:unnamed protein product [Mytilus edulis]|uniref:Uncharacterized protein n=1 Tax=Mytilus edulis TaxID=6550 RepID=A0A8S3R3H5_MYTED|nr:unnamed protein product [Mytilus edulis]
MYRRTKKPLESCQYYERAGHFEKAIDVLLEHKQFENAIHALNRYERLKKDDPHPERPKLHKLRDNQTVDQINRNAAVYYHKQKDRDEMKKALNRIHDIHFRVKFLKERFDGNNDYIKLAASIYLENGQRRKAGSLYFEYGYTKEAIQLFKKDKETYMIGKCLLLQSIMDITLKADGSAICTPSTSVDEVRVRHQWYTRNNCKRPFGKKQKWFSEVTKAIDEQLQKVWASITLIGKSQNTEGRSTLFRRGNLSSSNDAFLQLIRLDIQNVKLENVLNKCNTDLDLNEKQKLILDEFERSYSAFTKCRTLIDDLVYAVQRRGIVTPIIDLLKFLNVSQQMKMYFDSEFHKFRKSSRMRGNSVARCFEVLTFHKMFGMKHNVNNYHTNLEEKVLDELKNGILNRHGAISCGFISNVSIKTPYVMSVVRSFSQSLDSLNIFHNPYIAFLKFCKFIDRMKIPQTDETIPELSLLLIWIKYFIFVGFSIHSKVFDVRNSGKHCYFVVPSSYFTVLDFIEKAFLIPTVKQLKS